MKIIEKIKNFRWGYILIAFVSALIGACFFIFNNASLNALAISVGIAVIIGAIVLAFLSLASTVRGTSFGIKIVLSVAMLIAGLVVLIARDKTVNEMIGIFSLVMIIDGTNKLHTAAMSKRFKVWSWMFIMVLAVILIAGGYCTLRWLTVENSITVYILGSLFAIDSVANFFSAFYIGAYEKRSENQTKEKLYSQLDSERSSGDDEGGSDFPPL